MRAYGKDRTKKNDRDCLALRAVIWVALCMLLAAGCSAGGEGEVQNDGRDLGGKAAGGRKASEAQEIPNYERSTAVYSLTEEANPYRMSFSEKGFFYDVMEAGEDNEPEYAFYFQAYEPIPDGQSAKSGNGDGQSAKSGSGGGQSAKAGSSAGQSAKSGTGDGQGDNGKKVRSFGVISGGYIQDYREKPVEDRMHLAVLRGGEEESILELEEGGKIRAELKLDEVLQGLEAGRRKLLVLPEEGYVVGMGEQAFLLDREGAVKGRIELEGTIREFCLTKAGELFAVLDINGGQRSTMRLLKLEYVSGLKQSGEAIDLPEDYMRLFPFGEGMLIITSGRADYCRPGGEEKTLMDLNLQGIFASQVQFAFGEEGEISLVCMDPSDTAQGVRLYTFRKRETASGEEELASGEKEAKKTGIAGEKEQYASDGRRILYVAVPENCYYQMDFHAKKYNQFSDGTFVQIDWFGGSLEDYLGKGNRPDVILFQDQIEAEEYVEKGVLADLLPLFEESETYSLGQLIPEAEGLLSLAGEEGIYAIPWIVRLLLRASDGSERDEDGKWDDIRFLTWYDDYMTGQEIQGAGELENLLFAALPDYYDEEAATADFTSGDFQELMRIFREVSERHVGKLDKNEIAQEKGVDVLEMACFSKWYASYRIRALRVPEIRMTGLPGRWGESIVTLRMVFPMGVLNTTEQGQEAFDFILYFASLQEPLYKGWPEADYGKNGGIAPGYFNLFEKNLREAIFETDLPFDVYVEFDEKGRPIPGTGYDFFYTEEHKEQLRRLFAQARAETRAQRVIFGMLQEEMEPYLKGQKDLESACEVLQSRAELYLKEQIR